MPQRSVVKVLGKPVEAQARYMVNRIEDKVRCTSDPSCPSAT